MKRLKALIATSLAFSIVAGTAFSAPKNTHDRNTKYVVVQEQKYRDRTAKKIEVTTPIYRSQKSSSNRHRSSVGHRFNKNEVVVIQDWNRRGLHRPGKGEVYAVKGGAIYLLAASSLIVKALVN